VTGTTIAFFPGRHAPPGAEYDDLHEASEEKKEDERTMAGELVHFDIAVNDVEKAVAFYKAVMGWEVEKYDMGDAEGAPQYYLIKTSDEESAVGGGIGAKQNPQQALLNYYSADGGLEAFNKRVVDNGGTVMMEKMPVPGWGWFSVCIDPEGNPFGGWVDDKDAKM
jgi:uncharacterized protein